VVGDCKHACDVSLEEFEDLQVYWLYFFLGGGLLYTRPWIIEGIANLGR
jgi:hypothetical protein